MELLQIVLMAFFIMGFVVYWTGKWLALIGEIPSFTVKSLIRNKGWIYWDDPIAPKKKINF